MTAPFVHCARWPVRLRRRAGRFFWPDPVALISDEPYSGLFRTIMSQVYIGASDGSDSATSRCGQLATANSPDLIPQVELQGGTAGTQ